MPEERSSAASPSPSSRTIAGPLDASSGHRAPALPSGRPGSSMVYYIGLDGLMTPALTFHDAAYRRLALAYHFATSRIALPL